MEGLQLNLFGKPEVWLDGTAVTAFESAKGLALLTYLAVTGQSHSRETLATLLWGEMPEATAKRNLTKALTNLRHLLDPYVLIERHSIAFNHTLPAAVDVTIFQAAIEGSAGLAPDDPQRDLAPLRQAVNLYRGDFLEGFYVKNALEFEEWALGQREYLRELVLQALRRLTEHSARLEADPGAALAYCQRWLGLDPWQEAAHRQMMRLLARSGQREAALAQYETCRRVLVEELGVEPMPETTRLYEQLKAVGTPPPHNLPPPPNAFVGREAELEQIGLHLARPTCRLLTVVGPGGIGKTRLALEAARRYLQPERGLVEPNVADGVYFVSLASLGPGQEGAGAGPNLTDLFNTLVAAVAEAVGLSFHGAADLKGQLLAYLRSKAMLLILDNFEHLIAPPFIPPSGGKRGGTIPQGSPPLSSPPQGSPSLSSPPQGSPPLSSPPQGSPPLSSPPQGSPPLSSPPQGGKEGGIELLTGILQQAPQIKLLVTSRERLNLQEEWVLGVEGLTYPPDEGPAGSLAGWNPDEISQAQPPNLPSSHPPSPYSAIALFVQRAQQTLTGFNLSEADLPYIVRLCQLVEGMPLGLELAGSWLPNLTCAEIVAELERSLDFLATPLRNLPARHRSLRAVFEHSWAMLAPEEQRVFGQLAVFRGGFTREAATRVAGASLPVLVRLADKSFIRRTVTGRYELHELMRQYAHEKLWLADEEMGKPAGRADLEMSLKVPIWQRHSSYYLNLVSRHEGALHGSNPQQAVAELRAELDNIRQAWRWAVTNACLADLESSIEALAGFYEMAGFFQEGAEMFGMAVPILEHETLPTLKGQPGTICRLLIKQAWFSNLLGAHEQAKVTVERGLALSQPDGNPLHLAEAQSVLGEIMKFWGEVNEAIDHYKSAVTIYRTLNQPRKLALTLAWLGDVYVRTQMFDEALSCLQEALYLDITSGNKLGQAFDTSSIGNVYAFKEMYETALAYNQNVLSLFEELDYPLGVSRTLNNIGLLSYNLEHYPEAVTALTQALQIQRRLGDVWDEANSLENLGAVYTALGKYAQAQQCLEQALYLFRGSKMGEAYVVYRLGQLYAEMGRYQKSREYLQRAVTLGEELNDIRLKAICIGELGGVFHRTKELAQALTCYDQAITDLQRIGSRSSTAQFIIQQALLLFEQGQLDLAQMLAAEGLQLAQEVIRPKTIFEGQLLQAKITFARGEQEMAVSQMKALITAAPKADQQAALHYELWKMGQGQEHARLALIHYQQLYTQIPHIVYQERLSELMKVKK